MPGAQDRRDAWWAARESAYRQRPEIRQEIERLRAEAAERARHDDARAALLEQRAAQGAPGADQALGEELTRQAVEDDPPEPSAKDDPGEWRAYFRAMYGRDMPLNAEYQAERHRIEAAAPPDIGGLAATYFEAHYPQGFDEIELTAEREGKTVEQVAAERDAAMASSAPASATQDPDPDLEAGLAGTLDALAEHAPASQNPPGAHGDDGQPKRDGPVSGAVGPRLLTSGGLDSSVENSPHRAQADKSGDARLASGTADAKLDDALADVFPVPAGHGRAGQSTPAARHADGAVAGFDDIWAAFGQLRQALGLPEAPGDGRAAERGGRDGAAPVSAAVLDDVMAEARACAAWYRDAPEWQRITQVTGAARALVGAIRAAAGDYWSEISQDIRVRGFMRTLAARTCRTVSSCASVLAGKLEQAGRGQTAAWRAMSLLHRTSGAVANRVIGYLPAVRDVEQIIAKLGQQLQPAARPAAAGSPAALAALSFPAPVSQATTAAASPARRPAATKAAPHVGGPRH